MQTEADVARFGEEPGTAVSKQTGSGYGPGGNLLDTLYESQVLYPTKGVDINQRPNDMIFLKGIKYCANFVSTRTGLTGSMFCNFALVSRKENVYSQSGMNENLFRSRSNVRAQDFLDTLEAIDRHCLPINSDKYHVWTHKRFKLRASNGTNLPGSKMLSGYLNINRQIRFDGSNRPNGEVTALWWFSDENTTSVGTVSPGALALDTNIMFTTYWDNPVSTTMLKQAIRGVRRAKYKRKSKSRGPKRGYQ